MESSFIFLEVAQCANYICLKVSLFFPERGNLLVAIQQQNRMVCWMDGQTGIERDIVQCRVQFIVVSGRFHVNTRVCSVFSHPVSSLRSTTYYHKVPIRIYLIWYSESVLVPQKRLVIYIKCVKPVNWRKLWIFVVKNICIIIVAIHKPISRLVAFRKVESDFWGFYNENL